MNDLPKRKHIRLRDYDYSQNGAYFITICVDEWHGIFWNTTSERVGAHSALRKCPADIFSQAPLRVSRPPLSDIGLVVEKAINNIPQIYSSVILDKYVIMPNHIHMIIRIDDDRGRTMSAPTNQNITISRIIKQCKEFVTKQIGFSPWQRSFHDHIIRNEEDYLKIWQYIDENPAKWTEDRYYKP